MAKKRPPLNQNAISKILGSEIVGSVKGGFGGLDAPAIAQQYFDARTKKSKKGRKKGQPK